MITKQRLEELIEQGATIWTVNKAGNINPVKTNKTCEIQRQYLMKEGQIYSYIEQTFETKEEAEWHKEFGCIERTQRLELPTWEWMQPKEDEQDVYYSFYNYKHELMGIRVTKQKIALYKSYRCSDLTSTVDIFDNTKANYTLACRKAKELFLGENK